MNKPNQYLAANEGPLILDTPEMSLEGDALLHAPEDCIPTSSEPNTLYVPEKPTTETVDAINREMRVLSKSHISPDAMRTARKVDGAPPRERRRATPIGQRRVRRGVNNAKAPGKPPFTSNPRLARQIANLQQDK